MSLLHIKALVPPPSRPCELGDIKNWPAVEEKLSLSLPTDYRDFVLTYGTGLFARFYIIYNPFSTSEWSNLEICVERLCSQEREFKRDWPDRVPFPIYPECPGLLPWGGDENGNYYYWLTDGRPDSWQVVSDEVRGEGFREYGRCMTDFLCDVMTGKIEALAGDYPKDEDRIFEPWKKSAA
jgi:hypothetical protein